MNYEIISVKLEGEESEHVIITREDGSFESFPVDDTNPRYIQFLLETEGE